MTLTKSLMTGLVLLFAFAKAVPFERYDLEVNRHTEKEINYRLPSGIIPIHYNIKLIPYIAKGNFDGETSIDLEIRRPTTKIVLHSKNLKINEKVTYLKCHHDSYDFSNQEGHDTFHWPIKHEYENKSETLTIDFGIVLEPRSCTLNLQFAANFSDNLYGFYRTSHTNRHGETIWLAMTHFETVDARRAFPCLDEPQLKATFNISIKHYDNYTALSNMPVLERSGVSEDGKVWTHFKKTPVMSTYLIAFALLADYNRISNANGTISVWCRQEVISNARFFFEAVQKATIELENYLNSTIQVPKIDHIAVPQHARSGMENWGLIIYKESKILYNEDADSVGVRGAVAMIATHEISHQWFGNLISPAWWTYIWLNEGFATYLQYYITDKVFPDLQLIDYFTILALQNGFSTDPGERRLNYNVSTPQEIRSLFSSIIYLKSTSILRMLSHCVTEDIFHHGLIEYVQKHQFNVASSDDLWKSLQKALDSSNIPHFNIKQTMSGWVEQIGYPIVRIERNYITGKTEITQQQFLRRKNNGSDENIESNKWWIPFTFTTGSKLNFTSTLPLHWLSPYTEYLMLDGIESDDFIIVNLQQTGFYRVNYDFTNWMRIADYLNSDQFTKIHVRNRAQIINDAYYLVKSEEISPTIFLELTNYLERETDLIPWYPVLQALKDIQAYLKCPELGTLLKPHILRLMNNLIETAGFDEHHDDDHLTKLKRLQTLDIICALGHSDCRKRATTRLKNHLENPNKHRIPSYLYHFTYCMGMCEANETTWNKMLRTYSTRRGLLYLTCTENSTIINNLLNMTIESGTMFSLEDSLEVYLQLLNGDYEKTDITLNFILKNWNELALRYSMDEEQKILNTLTKSVASMEQIAKVRAFLMANRKEEFLPSLIETETSLTKVARYTTEIRNWLESRKSGFPARLSRN